MIKTFRSYIKYGYLMQRYCIMYGLSRQLYKITINISQPNRCNLENLNWRIKSADVVYIIAQNIVKNFEN